MARPRIFVSSTFYDLRHVRNDLERFIKELGYDPVLNERGHVAYGRQESLEQYCYREISNCDVLVNIIGSRFGTESSESPYSISQIELKTAHDLNKQVYVFVERSVHVEYRTWLLNSENGVFRPSFVNDVRVYKFIKEVYELSLNNVIADFDSVSELIGYLREQWSGLFQRFLQEESRREDFKISSNLKATAEALAEIIKYTTRERDETIRSILVHGHPVFAQIADAIPTTIRVQFFNRQELHTLFATFGYEESGLDSLEFTRTRQGDATTIKVDNNIFDENGKLQTVAHQDWFGKFVQVDKRQVNDDDIPF